MQLKPDADFADRFAEHARATRAKPGNLFMYLVRDEKDPTKFSTMEAWDSFDYFQQHVDDDEHQEFAALIKPLFAVAPDERRYELVQGMD